MRCCAPVVVPPQLLLAKATSGRPVRSGGLLAGGLVIDGLVVEGEQNSHGDASLTQRTRVDEGGVRDRLGRRRNTRRSAGSGQPSGDGLRRPGRRSGQADPTAHLADQAPARSAEIVLGRWTASLPPSSKSLPSRSRIRKCGCAPIRVPDINVLPFQAFAHVPAEVESIESSCLALRGQYATRPCL